MSDTNDRLEAISDFVAWSKAGREIAHRFARLGLPMTTALQAAAGQLLLPDCPHHGPWKGERTPCCIHEGLRRDRVLSREGVGA